MKTWDQLTEEQKKKALETQIAKDLEAICCGYIRFNDEVNGDKLQEAIDKAIAEAEQMQTPWFAHEYVMAARYWPGEGHIVEDDGLWPVSEFIEGIALGVVEEAVYLEPGEKAFNLEA